MPEVSSWPCFLLSDGGTRLAFGTKHLNLGMNSPDPSVHRWSIPRGGTDSARVLAFQHEESAALDEAAISLVPRVSVADNTNGGIMTPLRPRSFPDVDHP